MDYVESLRVFRAVADAKGIRRAADSLGMAPAMASRAITSLEQRFGTRLFERTTRSISLTESGGRVYERCCRILDNLSELETETTTETHVPTGVLRLVAHTTVTVNRLVPLIATFRKKYPNVSLDVTLTERPVDLVGDGYDLGIVLPFMLSTDLAVTRLLERIPLTIVAAQEYLETRSRPEHPAELKDHVFVTLPPSLRKPVLTFLTEDQDVTVPIKSDLVSNSAAFNREMVLQGIGIGVLPEALIQTEISQGRLVRLLGGYEIKDGAIEVRLAYNTRTLMPAKVRVFIDHATEFFAKTVHSGSTG